MPDGQGKTQHPGGMETGGRRRFSTEGFRGQGCLPVGEDRGKGEPGGRREQGQLVFTAFGPNAMNQYDESYYSRGKRTGIISGFVISLSHFMQLRRKAFRGTPGRVLEIGFGDGSFLKALAGRGWDAYGIDVSDEAVKMAWHKGLEATKGELLDCGLKDSLFDLVVLRHVLEHIRNPVETLVEIRRVLKPNGTLYMLTFALSRPQP